MKANKSQKKTNNLLKSITCENEENEGSVPEICGERIRDIRKKEDLTQERLAEKLGIDVTTLRKVENSESLLSASAAMRLYEEFGYSLDWIYGMSEIAKTTDDKYLVDIRNVVRVIDKNVHITIPKKFFDILAREEEIKRVKNEIQADESSIPFIQGVAKQERRLLLHMKCAYYCATIAVQDFEQKENKKERKRNNEE